MSNRQNAYRYGGSGGSSNGWENIGALLPMLLGKDKVSGGFQTGPDGQVVYTPYQGSKGFLGGGSRGEADALNRAILQAQYIQQLQQQAALAQQKEANRGMLEVEKERAKSAADIEKARSDYRFYEQNQKDITAKEEADRKHAQLIEAEKLRQALDILKQFGATATALPNYETTVNPLAVSNAQKTALNQGSNLAQMAKAIEAPGSQEALTRGLQAERLAPEFKNISQIPAIPPNSLFLTPPGLDLNKQASLLQTTTETQPMITDPSGLQVPSGAPLRSTKISNIPANPAIINKYKTAPSENSNALMQDISWLLNLKASNPELFR